MIRAVAVTLAVGAIAAAVSLPATAAKPAFRYDPKIGWWVHQALEMASEYTGSEVKTIPLPTYIRCFTNDTVFEAGLRRDGASVEDAHLTIAYYDPGTSWVNVRATTCNNVRLFTGRDGAARPVITEITAGAMSTVLHEALHRQGLDDERTTECYGNETTKFAGWNAWWQYVPDSSDASWAVSERWGTWAMKLAFQYSRHSVADDYQMSEKTCLARVKRKSWGDLVS